MIDVKCDKCGVTYNLSDDDIPRKSISVRCPNCGNKIVILGKLGEKNFSSNICPNCGKRRNPDDIECPFCGVIYEKAEIYRERTKIEEIFKKNLATDVTQKERFYKSRYIRFLFDRKKFSYFFVILIIALSFGSMLYYKHKYEIEHHKNVQRPPPVLVKTLNANREKAISITKKVVRQDEYKNPDRDRQLEYNTSTNKKKHEEELKLELKEKYISLISEAFETMSDSKEKCLEMCQEYIGMWEDSPPNLIQKNLEIVYKAFLKTDGYINKINQDKRNVEEALNDLNKLPDFYPESHRKIIQLYGIYSQLHKLATFPSGNLITYIKNVAEIKSSFVKMENELSVTIPR